MHENNFELAIIFSHKMDRHSKKLLIVSHKIPNVGIYKFLLLMFLVSYKKSYLVCVESTNFRIFTQPNPNFFSKYKIETANRGQRQLLKNK